MDSENSFFILLKNPCNWCLPRVRARYLYRNYLSPYAVWLCDIGNDEGMPCKMLALAACNLILNVRFCEVLNVGFCWVLTCPKTNRNLTVVLMLVLVKKLPFA